jgi:hypothetical protein
VIIAAKRVIKVEYSLYSMLSLLVIVCGIVAWILTAEEVGLGTGNPRKRQAAD